MSDSCATRLFVLLIVMLFVHLPCRAQHLPGDAVQELIQRHQPQDNVRYTLSNFSVMQYGKSDLSEDETGTVNSVLTAWGFPRDLINARREIRDF